MSKLVCALVFAMSLPAFAHELDSERTVSAEQVEKAQNLPQTTVVRVSKTDPNDVQVVHLNEKLPAGKKVENLKFEKVALNAEVSGLAVNSGNELDATSSTSSWSFGYYGYNNYNRGYVGYGYGRGYGYGVRTYGYTRPYYAPTTYSPYYYPTYRYAGYSYNYAPYWSYSDSVYNYAYCDWY